MAFKIPCYEYGKDPAIEKKKSSTMMRSKRKTGK